MRGNRLLLVVAVCAAALAGGVVAARESAQGAPKPSEAAPIAPPAPIAPAAPAAPAAPTAPAQSAMKLESDAFKSGEAFPVKFTADGAGTSPALRWEAAPEGVKSFAIVMDDPDARGFVHWIVWGFRRRRGACPRRCRAIWN